MAPVNSSWHKWVFASLAKHIHDSAVSADLPMVIELIDTRSDAWKTARQKAEATIIGPSTREVSKGCHAVDVSVVVIVTSQISEGYTHQEAVGAIANALDRCITVYEYGPDNPSPDIVGILTPDVSAQARVRVTNIKPSQPDNLCHSTIEVGYTGFFTEE